MSDYIDKLYLSGQEIPIQDSVAQERIQELFESQSCVKSAITEGYVNNPPVANGSWNKNGTYTAVNPRRLRTDFIPVKIGDKIEIDNGTFVHSCAAWENTLSTETNIRADYSWVENDEVIVSAVNGYYIVVFAKPGATQNVSLSEFDGYIHLFSNEIYRNTEKIKQTNENVDKLSDMVDLAITSVDVPIYSDSTVALTNTTGSVIANGTINTNDSYANNQYSQKIPVSEGDILTPIKTGDSAWFRFVCAYNGNSAVSSAGTNNGTSKYVVPQGIDGVIVSTPIYQGITFVKQARRTGTQKKVYTKGQKLGSINWHGSLSDGDSVELLPSNVRFNVVWNFTGHVSTMGKITIGIKIPDGTVKELCSVDATKIYYRLNNGTIANEAHGLTISEDLQIKIDSPFKVNELGSITICSDGMEYTLLATAYGTDMTGCPYLVSNGTEMTDCAFSWIPKDIDKPIWVFGDSWVSMYDTRWPYYMVRDGYTNTWMLNGFAGEDTDEAYESLENLLTIRKPDYIVWLLGMNNGDSSTAVNSVWKAIYDKLVQLCEDYSINLILYTVPNTPTINNNFKNAIVRASGYRYIDGAAAVGDDGEGNWFTNFEQSASDHNHTSGRGARALCYRILADFPEIAGNGL